MLWKPSIIFKAMAIMQSSDSQPRQLFTKLVAFSGGQPDAQMQQHCSNIAATSYEIGGMNRYLSSRIWTPFRRLTRYKKGGGTALYSNSDSTQP
jgi:hypothetical protein